MCNNRFKTINEDSYCKHLEPVKNWIFFKLVRNYTSTTVSLLTVQARIADLLSQDDTADLHVICMMLCVVSVFVYSSFPMMMNKLQMFFNIESNY